jgi:hypothetical protein
VQHCLRDLNFLQDQILGTCLFVMSRDANLPAKDAQIASPESTVEILWADFAESHHTGTVPGACGMPTGLNQASM